MSTAAGPSGYPVLLLRWLTSRYHSGSRVDAAPAPSTPVAVVLAMYYAKQSLMPISTAQRVVMLSMM